MVQQSCGTVCETIVMWDSMLDNSHVGQYVGQQSCGAVCETTAMWDSMLGNSHVV